MDELQRQVRRAQRRLAAQRLLGALGWCWFVSLLAALALMVAEKFHPLGFAAWTWAGGALGGAMVAGLIAALAWAALDSAEAPGGGHRARPPLPTQGTGLQHAGDAGRGAGDRSGPGAG